LKQQQVAQQIQVLTQLISIKNMLSPEEQKIAEYGKAQGKTLDEVKSAVSKYRATQIQKSIPQEEAPKQGFISGVASDFKSRVGKAANAQVSALQGKQSDASAALQTLGQGANFVGDVISRAIPEPVKKAIGGTLNVTSQLVPKSISDAGADAILKYDEWKTANPEAAANVESIGALGTLVPIGGVVKAGTQAGVKGALIGTGKALSGASDVVTGTGKTIKGAGSALYKSAITPTVKEAEQILKYRAETPFLTRISNTATSQFTPKSVSDKLKAPLTRAQTALEQGIAGTESMIGTQAKRAADSLWNNEIAPAVSKAKEMMTKDELFTPALERIASIVDPTRKKAMQNAYESLLDDYKSFPDSFDLTKAQALKRDIAKFTPTKIFKGQDVASELKTLQADMASAIRQKTYNVLSDENIKKKYLDWANLDELQKVGVKAISEASFKGGSGTLVSGLWDMATVPIKTVAGQILYRVGNKLEFTAPKGIKTFGEYLQKKGFAKPKEYELPEGGMGMSIKSSVTPEKVASKIDTTDRNIIVKFLDNPDAYELDNATMRLFSEMGINNADQPTQIRFLKEVLDISGL